MKKSLKFLRNTANKMKSLQINRATQRQGKHRSDRNYSNAATAIQKQNLPADNLTTLMSHSISNFSIQHISSLAQYRSKRMILDTLGVAMIGSKTPLAQIYRDFAETIEGVHEAQKATVWGTRNKKATAPLAAYLNGASCHSMDFDDTWHPATHPSSPVLPAILAMAEYLPEVNKPSLQDILVAYNIGVQVQGALLRCSTQARNIPQRLHPPALVGVMGSAAAVSRLLGHSPKECRHALSIAASFAGAPMANAGTTTKPLHAGKSARFGLEAALLAGKGVEGNENILDMASGFGAFYDDYDPNKLFAELTNSNEVILNDQDIALKRFPCHLGMHWGIDAALKVREELILHRDTFPLNNIREIIIFAPKSKYIDRHFPTSEHEGRHSFQFTVCSALLDGVITPETFHKTSMQRPQVYDLLKKTAIITPEDNIPSFEKMYVQVAVRTQDGLQVQNRCDTPYGHWAKPLSDKDLERKFRKNTRSLDLFKQNSIIGLVKWMSNKKCVSELTDLLHD